MSAVRYGQYEESPASYIKARLLLQYYALIALATIGITKTLFRRITRIVGSASKKYN